MSILNKMSGRGIASAFERKSTLFFLLILVGVIAYEGFIIKKSVDVIKKTLTNTVQVKNTSVRVNFEAYESNISRVEGGSTYTSNLQIAKNPFGIEKGK